MKLCLGPADASLVGTGFSRLFLRFWNFGCQATRRAILGLELIWLRMLLWTSTRKRRIRWDERWIKGRLKVDYVKNTDKVFVNQEPCFSQNWSLGGSSRPKLIRDALVSAWPVALAKCSTLARQKISNQTEGYIRHFTACSLIFTKKFALLSISTANKKPPLWWENKSTAAEKGKRAQRHVT